MKFTSSAVVVVVQMSTSSKVGNGSALSSIYRVSTIFKISPTHKILKLTEVMLDVESILTTRGYDEIWATRFKLFIKCSLVSHKFYVGIVVK